MLDREPANAFPDEDVLALKERIADWVADDLSAEDAEKVAALVAADPSLAKEAAFCRMLHEALPAAAHPSQVKAPGRGMAEVLRQRLRSEGGRGASSSPKPAPKPLIQFMQQRLPWLLAAAASLLAAVVLIQTPRPAGGANVYYDEYGAMVQPPPSAGGLPQVVSRTATAKPAVENQAENRAWMGVWTKPIALEGFDREYGLLVVRVAESGPAAQAGILPGDVILDIGSMPLSTRWCLPHALADYRPKQTVSVNFWREGHLKEQQTTLTLGHCLE